VLKVKR